MRWDELAAAGTRTNIPSSTIAFHVAEQMAANGDATLATLFRQVGLELACEEFLACFRPPHGGHA
ncbi:hypothetical protein [Sphingomonas morindae]|uniref:Uncharacterized protein n=1 Tax=Sphingomonas morindae TaxID=1541170 RepID=A0ABY4X6S0_9SPHN|nr:hypothetical protein [Sphingomonas morindae]USI72591.1 hypothetical protein LHA26_15085 [Sphingomonas morindae]